jgi:hypothetical protein
VDDDVVDGNQPYAIAFSATTSSDATYAALKPANVNVSNTDNDSAGFTVSAISGPTTEAGGQATFTVRLNSQPFSNVTVNFDSNDTTEGVVSPKSFTFTSSNWSTPQIANVTGVDDSLEDGTIIYAIVFSATTSSDAAYAALKPGNISVSNLDNGTRIFSFSDDPAVDDVADKALYNFFAGLSVTSSHFIFVEVTGGNYGGAWCAENAKWYADQYVALAASGGSIQSGAWNKYVRPGPTGSTWYGPITTGYMNYYGPKCTGWPYDWCSEWAISSPGAAYPLHFGIMPAPTDSESFATGSSPDVGSVPLRVASTRAMACGF